MGRVHKGKYHLFHFTDSGAEENEYSFKNMLISHLLLKEQSVMMHFLVSSVIYHQVNPRRFFSL